MEKSILRSIIKCHAVLAKSWVLASITRSQSRDEIAFQVRNWQIRSSKDGRINLQSSVLRMLTPNMAGCHTELKFEVTITLERSSIDFKFKFIMRLNFAEDPQYRAFRDCQNVQ